MKKLALSSVALALWLHGQSEAQSPFFSQPAQPVVPAAASAQPASAQPPSVQPAPRAPSGPVTPVRVHFGGALTRDGTVPVSVYLNQPPPSAQVSRVPAPGVRQVSTQAQNDLEDFAKTLKPNQTIVNAEDVPASLNDTRFIAPPVDDMHRPDRAPCGYRWYGVGEYLHWWAKEQDSPVLLQVEATEVRIGDIDDSMRQGGRITIGHWLDTCRPWAIEATGFLLGNRRKQSTFSSNGVVTLAHPFIDADTGVPDDLSVAVDPPDLAPRSGSSTIEAATRMYGFEVNLRRELLRSCHGHFDFIIGYRQLHLDEAIAIRDQVVYDTAPSPLSDATVTAFDEFGTHNRIFAGQVGLEGEVNWWLLHVGAWGKFALGSNDEVVNVSGATQVRSTPGRPPAALDGQSFPGGIYAQPSNIGRFQDNQLTVVPEVGVNVGLQITPGWRIGAGYNFLYINNVVRPGDQIDPFITPTQVPQIQPTGPTPGTSPAPPAFVESSYWVHGITVQMEFRY